MVILTLLKLLTTSVDSHHLTFQCRSFFQAGIPAPTCMQLTGLISLVSILLLSQAGFAQKHGLRSWLLGLSFCRRAPAPSCQALRCPLGTPLKREVKNQRGRHVPSSHSCAAQHPTFPLPSRTKTSPLSGAFCGLWSWRHDRKIRVTWDGYLILYIRSRPVTANRFSARRQKRPCLFSRENSRFYFNQADRNLSKETEHAEQVREFWQRTPRFHTETLYNG